MRVILWNVTLCIYPIVIIPIFIMPIKKYIDRFERTGNFAGVFIYLKVGFDA